MEESSSRTFPMSFPAVKRIFHIAEYTFHALEYAFRAMESSLQGILLPFSYLWTIFGFQ